MKASLAVVLVASMSACLIADHDDESTIRSESGSGSGFGSGFGSGSGSGSGSTSPLPPDDDQPTTKWLSVPLLQPLVSSLPSSGSISISTLLGQTLIEVPGLPSRIISNDLLTSDPTTASTVLQPIECAAFTTSTSATSSTVMTPRLANPPSTWRGRPDAGCSTLAVYQCDVRLGRRSTTMTETTWNTIADGIKQDESGFATGNNVDTYYRNAGYCTETRESVSLRYLCKRYREGADVKITYLVKVDGEWIGHTNTVIGCDEYGLIVNESGTAKRVLRPNGVFSPAAIQDVDVENRAIGAHIYAPCPPKAGS